MKNYRMSYALCLVILFLGHTSSLQAELPVEVKPKSVRDRLVKHYSIHAAAGFTAMVACVVSFVVGAVASEIANPGILQRIRKNQYFEWREAAPVFAATAAGVYCLYKTPQWTDTYVLGYKDQRTGKQNIITFLNRMLIPVPFGVLTGEYLAGTDAHCYKQ